jgi:hypothetical protein
MEHNPENLQAIMARIGKRYFAIPATERLGAAPPASPEAPRAVANGTPPQAPDATTTAPSLLFPAALADYIPAEVFLENMGFFTPSSKTIRGIYLKEKKVAEKTDPDGTKRVITVEISANHRLGLPITSDLDYYRAFLKIFYETLERSAQFHLPIATPTLKLLQYAGKSPSKITWREVKDWLERMTGTLIKGAVFRAKIGDYEEAFLGTVFSQVVMTGQRLRNGTLADTNYVWPAPWFLANYLRGYTRRIDLDFHKRLRKPIAKALYPLLETGWYASDGQPYKKSYRALCAEFLLTRHQPISLVKQQLDPAHQELQAEGFLGKHAYKKGLDGHDWVILYWPGEKFFHDQAARAERRHRAHPMTVAPQQCPSTPPQPMPQPPSPPASLLEEVLACCGDRQNKGAYITALRTYPEGLIRMTLFETRQAALEGKIRKSRGAFFMDTLKRLATAHAQTHPPSPC